MARRPVLRARTFTRTRLSPSLGSSGIFEEIRLQNVQLTARRDFRPDMDTLRARGLCGAYTYVARLSIGETLRLREAGSRRP